MLRVLVTNSLFMSLPVAMYSISKTRAAITTQLVAFYLEWRRTKKLNLSATAYVL